jgi:lysyl-tRNA synthetase, class I
MNEEPPSSLHWADQMAEEIIRRVDNDPLLQKVVKKNGYIVYDEKTPSGKIHIGSGRGWIIHDVMAKALRERGLHARFILSSDDIDPFDRMNAELPSSFEQYLGMPFYAIPSPEPGYKSFSDYYFTTCTDKFAEFGVEAELESTGDRYIRGDFNDTIRTALDNAEKIQEIYRRLYGEAPDKLPFNPICEKCGKIGTTVAYEWNREKGTIKYRCSPDHVDWAKGCGYEGERSPFNGGGKFPWKVEWAAKWPTVGVVAELAGKDHFTAGGSRTMAIAVSHEVFNYPPPYPSTPRETGKGYEFFTVGGKKMSTSKGHGIGFAESTNYAPATILRYLLVATRPTAVIDFQPVQKNDLILLYERFDKSERIYFGSDEEKNPHEVQKHKRIYQLSYIGKLPTKLPPQLPFTLAALVVQVSPRREDHLEKLKLLGKYPKNPTKEDLEYLNIRLDFAKSWIENFAPDQFKFELRAHIDASVKETISPTDSAVFKKLVAKLETGGFTEEEFSNYLYECIKEAGLNSRDFFQKTYQVLFGKTSGPKLAPFMVAADKQSIINLLREAM